MTATNPIARNSADVRAEITEVDRAIGELDKPLAEATFTAEARDDAAANLRNRRDALDVELSAAEYAESEAERNEARLAAERLRLPYYRVMAILIRCRKAYLVAQATFAQAARELDDFENGRIPGGYYPPYVYRSRLAEAQVSAESASGPKNDGGDDPATMELEAKRFDALADAIESQLDDSTPHEHSNYDATGQVEIK